MEWTKIVIISLNHNYKSVICIWPATIGPVTFGPVWFLVKSPTDIQKVMHMSPPWICTGWLKISLGGFCKWWYVLKYRCRNQAQISSGVNNKTHKLTNMKGEKNFFPAIQDVTFERKHQNILLKKSCLLLEWTGKQNHCSTTQIHVTCSKNFP